MYLLTQKEIENACHIAFDELFSVESFMKRVKVVFENKEKRIFGLKLKNGEVVTVRCAENDTWDSEKALLACYVKYLNGNNGKFNEYFKLLDNVVKTGKEEK